MILNTFENDVEYKKAQYESAHFVRKKGKTLPKTKAFYWEGEGEILRKWFENSIQTFIRMEGCNLRGELPTSVLCHGVRKGEEMLSFKELFNCSVIGTDLFPQSAIVLEHDFRKKKRAWIGAFDMVYSNSLDHSDEPEKTLRVWLRQLSNRGFLVINWTCWDTKVRGGDCFGASLDEYYELMRSVGTVVDLLYCRANWFLFIVTR